MFEPQRELSMSSEYWRSNWILNNGVFQQVGSKHLHQSPLNYMKLQAGRAEISVPAQHNILHFCARKVILWSDLRTLRPYSIENYGQLVMQRYFWNCNATSTYGKKASDHLYKRLKWDIVFRGCFTVCAYNFVKCFPLFKKWLDLLRFIAFILSHIDIELPVYVVNKKIVIICIAQYELDGTLLFKLLVQIIKSPLDSKPVD